MVLKHNSSSLNEISHSLQQILTLSTDFTINSASTTPQQATLTSSELHTKYMMIVPLLTCFTDKEEQTIKKHSVLVG